MKLQPAKLQWSLLLHVLWRIILAPQLDLLTQISNCFDPLWKISLPESYLQDEKNQTLICHVWVHEVRWFVFRISLFSLSPNKLTYKIQIATKINRIYLWVELKLCKKWVMKNSSCTLWNGSGMERRDVAVGSEELRRIKGDHHSRHTHLGSRSLHF